jgi:hypothetical protein
MHTLKVAKMAKLMKVVNFRGTLSPPTAARSSGTRPVDDGRRGRVAT